MRTLADLRTRVAQCLDSPEAPVDAWRWKADSDDIDYAFPLHIHRLTATQELGLMADLKAWDNGAMLHAANVENGFLNLRFQHAFWGELVGEWLGDHGAFGAACGLPADLWEVTIFWKYRMLKTFHQARVVADMTGWISAAYLQQAPPSSEIQKLKSLLALGGMLHQKREIQLKRSQMMMQIEAQVAQLWQHPILLPDDPMGSAWRQAVLKLSLAAAATVGAPLKQDMEEALRMQY
jgi:hypothetical protein